VAQHQAVAVGGQFLEVHPQQQPALLPQLDQLLPPVPGRAAAQGAQALSLSLMASWASRPQRGPPAWA
jgi:hypothetical protein